MKTERTVRLHHRKSDFLHQFGPAWLVMMADVDAACIIGGAQTGAIFGYGLIWLFVILIIPLYIVQELAGRISIATGRGLGSVISDHYSRKTSLLMTAPMALTDVITYAIEYIGIAVGLEVIGISIYYTIPLIYIIHILVVTRRKYVQAEKSLLVISGLLMAALTLTLLYRGIEPFTSPLSNPFLFKPSSTYFFLLAANIGAVVMPFMIFFQASATGIKSSELSAEGIKIDRKRSVNLMRKETLLGAIVSEILMIIIEMTFTGVPQAGNSSVFASARDLGNVLTPIAGPYSLLIFGVGLISAAFLALVVISLASAWGIAESLSISKKSIWIVYVLESFPALIAALLIPSGVLVNAVLYLLVLFVFVLIGPMAILYFIGKNKKIMGDLVLSGKGQIIYLITFVVIVFTAVFAIAL